MPKITQLFVSPAGRKFGAVDVETTSTSNQTVLAVPVPTDKAVMIQGEFIGITSSQKVAGGRFFCLGKNYGGTMSIVSPYLVDLFEDLTDNPDVNFNANNSTKKIELRVNSGATQTIQWTFFYSYKVMG